MSLDGQLEALRDLPVGSPGAERIRARLRRRRRRRALVVAVGVTSIVVAAAAVLARTDDAVELQTADPGGSVAPCDQVDLDVPAPQLRTSFAWAELDLLWINHSCGYAADSAIHLGGREPKVLVVGSVSDFERGTALRGPVRGHADRWPAG